MWKRRKRRRRLLLHSSRIYTSLLHIAAILEWLNLSLFSLQFPPLQILMDLTRWTKRQQQQQPTETPATAATTAAAAKSPMGVSRKFPHEPRNRGAFYSRQDCKLSSSSPSPPLFPGHFGWGEERERGGKGRFLGGGEGSKLPFVRLLFPLSSPFLHAKGTADLEEGRRLFGCHEQWGEIGKPFFLCFLLFLLRA